MPDEAWISARTTCVICGHEEVQVFPPEAPALECSECGHMNESERDRAVRQAQEGPDD